MLVFIIAVSALIALSHIELLALLLIEQSIVHYQ